MNDNSNNIRIKMNYIDSLLSKLENNEKVSAITILQDELESLKRQIAEADQDLQEKTVVGKEEKMSKTRYYLRDGSVYVIKGNEYKYLYDSKSKTVTYVFENGQIERTFENGLKEIRRKDGTIVIKTAPKEFDFIK
jgi:hypothetical protein